MIQLKSARIVSSWLCIGVLLVLGCGLPSNLPIALRREPTATPRPTRTSRPTFTPTPTETSTPIPTPTSTKTNTPLPTPTFTAVPPTDTPVPPTPTNTRRPAPPPTATFTPAPPPPPTNTPAPSFEFSAGSPDGWPNCLQMGIFGSVKNLSGGWLAGYTIQVYTPGGGKIPGGEVITKGGGGDRNYEVNVGQPGNYQIVVSDGTRELSPRVNISVDSTENPNCDIRKKEPGAGAQWVKVDFTKVR